MKKDFTPFEREVLENLTKKSFFSVGYDENAVLFLSTERFHKHKEEWENSGLNNSKYAIKAEFQKYLDAKEKTERMLMSYYEVRKNLICNCFSHELYHVKCSDTYGGDVYTVIPLFMKYEDVFEAPIQELQIWRGF